MRAIQQDKTIPSIKTIHYFLVHDSQVEMVKSHAPLRKMRRLEPNLWTEYLGSLGGPEPEKMIIYHWRAPAEDKPSVEDFIALAAFRRADHNIWFYVAVIVVLGAAGSATQELLTHVIRKQYELSETHTQLVIIAGLVFLLLIWLTFARWKPYPRMFWKNLQKWFET